MGKKLEQILSIIITLSLLVNSSYYVPLVAAQTIEGQRAAALARIEELKEQAEQAQQGLEQRKQQARDEIEQKKQEAQQTQQQLEQKKQQAEQEIEQKKQALTPTPTPEPQAPTGSENDNHTTGETPQDLQATPATNPDNQTTDNSPQSQENQSVDNSNPQQTDNVLQDNPQASASNNNTGEHSTNTAEANSNSAVDISNLNETTFESTQDTEANTGKNIVSQKGAFPGDPKYEPTASGTLSLPTCGAIPFPVLSTSAAADADDFALASTGTDDHSTSTETANSDTSVSVANENCFELDDGLDVIAASGRNTLSHNEGTADLKTGNTDADGVSSNQGNLNQTTVNSSNKAVAGEPIVDDGENTDHTIATNQDTGEYSDNVAIANVIDELTVENLNQGFAEVDLLVEAVSGENILDDNEGDVTAETGDVDLVASLFNLLNINTTGSNFTHEIVNVFDNLVGNYSLTDFFAQSEENESENSGIQTIAKNSETGEHSTNEALASVEENTKVKNGNLAGLRNDLTVRGVSGQNKLNENEDLVELQTGNVNVLVSVLNLLNSNFSGNNWVFRMINLFNDYEGDLELEDLEPYLADNSDNTAAADNTQTGEHSTNTAIADLTEELTVENDNLANVKNNVNVLADSGRNQAVGNEDETYTETGQATADTDELNWINRNITGNKWVMLVVNTFGSWTGKIFGFPSEQEIDTSGKKTYLASTGGANGGGPIVEASNENTGEHSENTSEASATIDTTVKNLNTAIVENNINVLGISGQNQTNKNEDPVTVKTGDVNVKANLANFVNMNITGNDWVVYIVNVFKNFSGNLFFGEKPQGLTEENEPTDEQQLLADTGIGGLPDDEEDNFAVDDSGDEHPSPDQDQEQTVGSTDTASSDSDSNPDTSSTSDSSQGNTSPEPTNPQPSPTPTVPQQDKKFDAVAPRDEDENSNLLAAASVSSTEEPPITPEKPRSVKETPGYKIKVLGMSISANDKQVNFLWQLNMAIYLIALLMWSVPRLVIAIAPIRRRELPYDFVNVVGR